MNSISIITTVLDDEKNILRCLKSVSQQNNNLKIEHIIVDGGSADKTLEVINNFKKKKKYIKIFIKKNYNIYQGINYGIKKSKNNIIILLHSNDFFINSNVLKDISNIFKTNINLKAIYSNVSIVNRNNLTREFRFFRSKKLDYKDFINGIHPAHTGFFIKKEVFKRYGYYNESLKIASDFEFMLRVFGKCKVKAKYINKIFVVMTTGGSSNKNLINIVKSNIEVYKAYKINKIKINILIIIKKILRKLPQIKFQS